MIYIANIRLPTEKAHGLQIMKTCEAFSEAGERVLLLVPRRLNSLNESPFEYYRVLRTFSIRKIPTLDTVSVGLGYTTQILTFALSSFFYILFRKKELVYSRDEIVLYILSFLPIRFVWESHVGKLNFVVRRVLRRAKRVIVISEGLKLLYLQQGVSEDRITVAHDGVDLGPFDRAETHEQALSRLELPRDKKIVMYIGRLDGWKGADTLCAAAALLPATIQVVVIGGEPAQVDLFKKKFPNVLFLGFRPYREIADNLAAGDVVVLPNTAKDQISLRYTSPLKLFTYMASRRPIVVSEIPSIKEVLDDTCCYFVAPDTPKALAGGILQALADPRRVEKAQQAYARVHKYTWRTRAKVILTSL